MHQALVFKMNLNTSVFMATVSFMLNLRRNFYYSPKHSDVKNCSNFKHLGENIRGNKVK